MIYTHRFVPLFLFLHDVCKARSQENLLSHQSVMSVENGHSYCSNQVLNISHYSQLTTKLQLYVLKLWIQTACAQTACSSQLLVLLMQWSCQVVKFYGLPFSAVSAHLLLPERRKQKTFDDGKGIVLLLFQFNPQHN